MLFEYKKHLSKLEDEIDALAKDFEDYKITQSIPGIGEKIAVTIISEIGEIISLIGSSCLISGKEN